MTNEYYSSRSPNPPPRAGAARPGPYTGRGPRGYVRSDERLREEVCDLLKDHGELDARGIDVQVSNGEVTLEGSVDNRAAKRLAEDLAESVPGVVDVHNRLTLLGLAGRRGWALGAAEAKRGQTGIDWSRQVLPGMTVMGADGKDLGQIKELSDDSMRVARSLAPDLELPLRVVDNVRGDIVMLRIDSGQAEQGGLE